MTSQASKITTEILNYYENLRNFQSEVLSKKYRALKKQDARYRIFDFENPYYDMKVQSKNIVSSFEKMVKEMLDTKIDTSSIRNELDMMSLFLELKDQRDANIERLREL